MKSLIRKFILTNSIILCLSLIILGAVTVRQRSDYNMYSNRYSVLAVEKNEQSVTVKLDRKPMARLDISFLSKLKRGKKILRYTPFGSAYYFIESTKALF